MKKAIVIGCSTGIGRALVRELAAHGYEVGLAGRSVSSMEELASELSTGGHVKAMDLKETADARVRLAELIDEMGGVDLVVVNSGVGHHDPDWEEEREIIEVNVMGFAAVARRAMEYFMERGSGHLVGITSIAALRGLRAAYSGSKAFAAIYLEALRLKADWRGLPIQVTDVKPGFVATPMTRGREGMFWVATTEEAAAQIYRAIRKRKRHVYVTRRWRLIAWVAKALPYPLVALITRRRQR
ncbi:MAG: SDR family NAD(P)-dependent oxidoreductase [Gemmatimonadetes bacterium]|uniref:SDR family NAD(P)-dependent oxidoreductase n=1 Tax=Candidatus Kutchimonas denitrificans TaxID=3056748 RepID=A0AAE4Z841_9BACT|nr:SDR family NAD(P)-dependent oxidoreductase [Gemmatimonadota bacterium]NIR74728.1 SDR family NAD(P)-dependent oxidoreductase [Candidatus Kutchimonas denitrificans]NIS01478.1 SDR family NAD(P)-dependent oxidoreductase [Gemmatimonadota bacterium]NIT67219.1 SDR family NAD(P)-dependent oxidoreductase [Gemmatimonadota bacterium]NIU52393.1 SDR family NAD(P)-dependent oxidoreductase [Gemmatimonadota bacterium]